LKGFSLNESTISLLPDIAKIAGELLGASPKAIGEIGAILIADKPKDRQIVLYELGGINMQALKMRLAMEHKELPPRLKPTW
jgi:hypothetical protein